MMKITRIERLVGLHMTVEELRTLAFEFSPADQYRLATHIAGNVGYILAPEPQIDPPLDDSAIKRA